MDHICWWRAVGQWERAGWVSCAAQDRGMPSHAAIFASTSVGHAEIGSWPNLRDVSSPASSHVPSRPRACLRGYSQRVEPDSARQAVPPGVRRLCLRPRAHLHLQVRVLDLAFDRHASTLARCPYRPLPTPCPVGHVEKCERLLRNVEVGRKTHMSPIVDGFNGAALATVGTTAPLPRWGI